MTELVLPKPVIERLTRWGCGPGWVICLVAVAGAVWFPNEMTLLGMAPLLASVVMFGLPHGAVDHLVPFRMVHRTSWWWSISTVVAVYVLVGALYAVAWSYVPVWSFLVFIGITWIHWGQGDVYALVVLQDVDHLPDTWQRVLCGAVRGAIPMLVPLVAFPEHVRAVAGWLVGTFVIDQSVSASLFSGTARWAVGIGLAVLIVGHLASGFRRRRRGSGWGVDVFETLLLVLFFATVPPIFAIGLYFCLWHSLRHVVRLSIQDDAARVDWSRAAVTSVIQRFARDAAPMTILALVLFAGFVAVVPQTPGSMGEWSGAYLVFISILTLPHMIIVGWMDALEGVWQPAE